MPQRSRRSLILSLLLHAGVAVLANLGMNHPAVSRPDSLLFVASQVPERVPLLLNTPEPVVGAWPEPEPLIAPDLPEPEAELAPPAPEPAAEPEPAPEPRPAREREVAAPAPPPPPAAAEQELFADARHVAAQQPAGEVVESGFDREVARAPVLMERSTAVGLLDAPTDTHRSRPERRTAAVISTGFDGPAREPAPAAGPRGVVTRAAGFDAGTEGAAPVRGANQAVATGVAGFGAPAAPEAEPPLAPPATASGFEVDLPDPPPAAAAPSDPSDSPVEIEFKPTPEYSAEARAEGIEGDVLLEVEFSAAGVVRVLRVIKGLGYGLDTLAVRAAEEVRFTPAVRNGQPVDTRAVVTIMFRLA